MCERDHKKIKADDDAWHALPLVGIQVVEADPNDPGAPAPEAAAGALELRDCSCGSTLARPVRV